jgi:hypothetical protein
VRAGERKQVMRLQSPVGHFHRDSRRRPEAVEVRVDLPMTVPIELPHTADQLFATDLWRPRTADSCRRSSTRRSSSGRATSIRAGLPARASSCGCRSRCHRPPAGAGGDHFTPACPGASVATWLPFTVDLQGRVRGGGCAHAGGRPPPAASHPDPNGAPSRRATSLSPARRSSSSTRCRQRSVPGGTSRAPGTRRSGSGRDHAKGRCARVVFLPCPDDCAAGCSRIVGGWTFPGPGSGTDAAWCSSRELEVEVSGPSPGCSRSRQAPRARRGSAARPPGV